MGKHLLIGKTPGPQIPATLAKRNSNREQMQYQSTATSVISTIRIKTGVEAGAKAGQSKDKLAHPLKIFSLRR